MNTTSINTDRVSNILNGHDVVNGFEVDIASDVREVTEDTEDDPVTLQFEVLYVQLTDRQGNRWNNRTGFATYRSTREIASARASRFAVRVIEALEGGANPENSNRWEATFPRYGSAAYENHGADMDLEMERRANAEEAW